MPRSPRLFLPDTIHHVVDRGVERRLIFHSDEDRQYFLSLLLGALRAAGCALFAYCLMGNHFHALVGVASVPLGIPLHAALTSYSLYFNSRYARVGHLFQSRYSSTLVHDDAYLHRVIAYIHANPVRARLVRRASDWKWSSHLDWTTLARGPLDFPRLEEISDIPVSSFRESYLERIAEEEAGGPRGLSLDDLVLDVASMLGIDPAGLRSGQRGERFTRAKEILLERAAADGHSDADVARALGCTRAAISLIRKRRTDPSGVNESACPFR